MAKLDSGWNLPPGVHEHDIPGNRPEDERHERLAEATEEMYEALKLVKQVFDRPSCSFWYVMVNPSIDQSTIGDVINKALLKAEGK